MPGIMVQLKSWSHSDGGKRGATKRSPGACCARRGLKRHRRGTGDHAISRVAVHVMMFIEGEAASRRGDVARYRDGRMEQRL